MQYKIRLYFCHVNRDTLQRGTSLWFESGSWLIDKFIQCHIIHDVSTLNCFEYPFFLLYESLFRSFILNFATQGKTCHHTVNHDALSRGSSLWFESGSRLINKFIQSYAMFVFLWFSTVLYAHFFFSLESVNVLR